jgi:hypothetical protein
MGGGYTLSAGSDTNKISIVQNYPSSQTTWTVEAIESQGGANSNWTLTAYAVCAIAV